MKKVLSVLFTCLLFSGLLFSGLLFSGLLFTTEASASLKCEITDIIQYEDKSASVIMTCKKVDEIKIGDKVKVKVKRPKEQAIEGC